MNRRGFLKTIGLTAATAAIAPKILAEPLEPLIPIEWPVTSAAFELVTLEPAWWGIPYWQTRGYVGEYMGLARGAQSSLHNLKMPDGY